MACDLISIKLVEFHWGLLGAVEENAVESHLAACSHCLAEYWEVKKAMRVAENNLALPQAALRHSLRQVYASTFPARLGVKASGHGYLAQPWLVASCAAAAVFFVAVGLWLAPRFNPNPGGESTYVHKSLPVVDSASPTALNIHTL